VSDQVAARLLVVYRLAHQRPMMGAFLDAVGLPHENGLLGDDVTPPESDAVTRAARELLGRYPDADVRLYFTTLFLQDPTTWSGLEPVLAGEG
jgi:hypothetical protein